MTIFDEFRQQNFIEIAKKTAEDCRFLLYKTSIKNFLFVKSALLIYNHNKRCDMEKRDLALNRKILQYLVTIGIQPKLSGFEYLRLAIKLVMQNKNYLTNITKMLYPEIAELFSTRPACVERSIRHAIEVAYNCNGLLGLNDIYGFVIYNGKRKPTNGELIALLTEKLEIELVKSGA